MTEMKQTQIQGYGDNVEMDCRGTLLSFCREYISFKSWLRDVMRRSCCCALVNLIFAHLTIFLMDTFCELHSQYTTNKIAQATGEMTYYYLVDSGRERICEKLNGFRCAMVMCTGY